MLAGRGWPIIYLGPDTPIATIQEALAELEPRLVMVLATTRQRLRAARPRADRAGPRVSVAIAGAGATEGLARATGSVLLDGDPVTAAEHVAGDNR